MLSLLPKNQWPQISIARGNETSRLAGGTGGRERATIGGYCRILSLPLTFPVDTTTPTPCKQPEGQG